MRRAVVIAVLAAAVLALACEGGGLGQPEVKKGCDTRVTDGPKVHLGQVYAQTKSECDKQPQSHAVHLALWRKVGGDFQPQQIRTGRVVSWFSTCGGAPYPGQPIYCEVAVECVSGIYEVVVTVIGVGPDGLPISDGDGDWDMPERPRAEIRCPQR
jgi:hypothetical protein